MQNVQTCHQGDLRKTNVFNKSNQLRYTTSGSKIKESNFCCIVTLAVVFSSGLEDTPLRQFFSRAFICLTPFFSRLI